jgi:hypothetical protein
VEDCDVMMATCDPNNKIRFRKENSNRKMTMNVIRDLSAFKLHMEFIVVASARSRFSEKTDPTFPLAKINREVSKIPNLIKRDWSFI